MKVIVDFCLIPLGGDLSLSPYIAECQRILQQCGLKHELHAYGTNIEGEWEPVMEAIKRCHNRVHEMGAPRINTTLKIGTRVDRDDALERKVASVQALLQES
ncbi:MAG: MTH1187 family thiamine-binding protein [Spongiibacteraceae bacterium]|nr:MTH1187 family thiamine-binding protein [Spongiibacteraceae bacterium]